MKIKVVVADDHPVVADGLRFADVTDVTVEIVSQVETVEKLEPALREFSPDVLVMEVRLGGRDALKKLEEFNGEFSDINIVAFSGQENPTHIARAAAVGCYDYVSKTSSCQQLIRSLKSAAMGEPVPQDSLMVETQARMRRPRQLMDHDVPLTNREMQVLRHIAMGLSNREIGKSLGISVETVKEHVQNILRKLDVNDRTQAAVWAVKRRLV